MEINTRGPYAIDCIHYFTTKRGNQVRSMTLRDGDGNGIGMRFDHLGDLRAVASGFPLAGNAYLTLSLHQTPVREHATIRRWISGRRLNTAYIASSASVGTE